MDATNDRNFSRVPKPLELTKVICFAEYSRGIHGELIGIAVTNVLLAITAFLGNSLILVALHKESSLHAPSKLLFRTLAVCDLFVGTISQPLSVVTLASELTEQWDICRFASTMRNLVGLAACLSSLFTATAISVDRLLAFSLGLRYRQVVTLKRVTAIVISFCVISIVVTALALKTEAIMTWYSTAVIATCLLISLSSYAKITFLSRRNRNQINVLPRQTVQQNIASYRNTVFIILWVQLALVVCYLPHNIVLFLMVHKGPHPRIIFVWRFTGTLVFFNSSLNPILFIWKMRALKQAVRQTLRGIFSWCKCS